MYLSTRKIHHYIEATVTAVEPMDKFVLVTMGKYIAKPPPDCLLKEEQKVQITIDFYRQTLTSIASEACSRCPLKGNVCRYGVDGYKNKPL